MNLANIPTDMKGGNHGVLAVKAYTDKNRIMQTGMWGTRMYTEMKLTQCNRECGPTHDNILKESNPLARTWLSLTTDFTTV